MTQLSGVMDEVWYPRCRAILHLVFDGYGSPEDDSDEIIVPVLPKAATVHRNAYKQPDSYELTFDANDLPIDPDLIRAGAADVYIYASRNLRDEDFVVSRQYAATQDTTGFLPRDPPAGVALQADVHAAIKRWTLGNKPTCAGLFDEPEMKLTKSGKWVTIRGQDYTAYLSGRQWPPTPGGRARRIPVGRPLDETLRGILAEADPRHKLNLDVDPAIDDMPVVRPQVNAHARGIPVDTNTSYWDVMYKLAIDHGLILYVDGLDVVLANPKNISQKDDQRVRLFAWGANVEELTLKRKMGKESVPTIVMQGRDARGHVIEVEWPPGTRHFDSANAGKVAGGVEKSHQVTKVKAPPAHPRKVGKKTTTIHNKDEFVKIPAGHISDPKILLAMAQTRFHLLGRGERVAVLTTKEARDLRNSDLLGLGSGDAVKIDFADYNRELISNADVPRDAKIGHLLARGYNAKMAETVADHYTKLEGLRRPLRVREASYQFDSSDGGGVSTELELVDFMVVDDERAAGTTTQADQREFRLRKPDGRRLGLGHSAAEERTVFRPRRAK